MKKWFFTIGIIIVLAGAIAVAYCNTEVMYSKDEKALYYTNNEAKNYTDKSWEVSGYFNKGDKLSVYCVPGANWSRGPMDEDDEVNVPHRHIWMDVVDPNGNATEFNTAWTSYGESGDTGIFAEARIWVTNRTSGLFQPKDEPTYVGGVTAISGTYKVIVINEFDPSFSETEEPPYYLALDRESPYPTYPLTYLLPVGGSTMAAGAVISVLSARSKKKPKNKKAKT